MDGGGSIRRSGCLVIGRKDGEIRMRGPTLPNIQDVVASSGAGAQERKCRFPTTEPFEAVMHTSIWKLICPDKIGF
jgi:hypothetical protein